MAAVRRWSLQLYISATVALLIMTSGGLIGFLDYQQNYQAILNNQHTELKRIAEVVVGELNQRIAPARNIVSSLAFYAPTLSELRTHPQKWLPLLKNSLVENPFISSLYLAYPNGDFYHLRLVNTPELQDAFSAPSNAVLMLSQVQASNGSIRFYNSQGQELEKSGNENYFIDPRSRPWYLLAEVTKVTMTEPYPFFSGNTAGVTLTRRSMDNQVTIGVDISLSNVAQLLRSHLPSPSTLMAIFNSDMSIVSHSRNSFIHQHIYLSDDNYALPKINKEDTPLLQALVLNQGDASETSFSIEFQDRVWRGESLELVTDHLNLNLAVIIPEQELLIEARQSLTKSLWIVTLIILLSLPLAIWLSRRISYPIYKLIEQTQSIIGFDFSKKPTYHSNIKEVDQLSIAAEKMRSTIEQFTTVSRVVGQESNFDQLQQRYLKEILGVVSMPAGAIWLADKNKLNISAKRGYELLLPDSLSIDKSTNSTLNSCLVACIAERKTISRTIEYQQQQWCVLACPLINNQDKIVGLMAMFSDTQHPVSPHLLPFLNALGGMVTIAIQNRKLIDEQKLLLSSFLEMMADAIDHKSPYTGAHCRRVPVLTEMLAMAAQQEESGVFAPFSLNDDQWEELHIAAWLHDYGKISTPEYVIDKATKLETKYDRIHEIRTRFELLKRDLELDYWKQQACDGGPKDAREQLDRALQELDDDFEFIAYCNLGYDFLDPEQIKRLEKIAKRTWLQTLDPRLGLSHQDLERYPLGGFSAQRVSLLEDRPEHLIANSKQQTRDNDFNIQAPLHRFNLGELYNLSIPRGSLNNEERYIVNEHIIQTIKILQQLPFPEHLSNVAEIAGGHHEKIDGSGYPRGLRKDELPLTARMMAIADIFEALTASDRPYKKAKTLTEALSIMHTMSQDQHIDSDLFSLFLRNRIYLEYAQQYLKPEQIDTVNIDDYLGEDW